VARSGDRTTTRGNVAESAETRLQCVFAAQCRGYRRRPWHGWQIGKTPPHALVGGGKRLRAKGLRRGQRFATDCEIGKTLPAQALESDTSPRREQGFFPFLAPRACVRLACGED